MKKAMRFIPAVDKPLYRPPEERGVYNNVSFEERERDRQERAATGISYAAQQDIKNRLSNIDDEMKVEAEPPTPETRTAFALGKLFRVILSPHEQGTLVKSLTRGPRIERDAENAVVFLAAEAVRSLPGGEWENVFSFLDQGARR